MFNPSPYRPMPMSGENAEREVRRGINSARWAIVAQAVLYVALAGFVWYLAVGLSDDTGEFLWPLVLVTFNVTLMVALVVCAVLLGQRKGVVVKTIIWLEVAFMAVLLGGLIATFVMSSDSGGSAGAPVGVILWGLLMQAVLRPLQKPELRAAFGLPTIAPRQKKRK